MIPLFSIIPLEKGYRVYVVEEIPFKHANKGQKVPTTHTVAKVREITTSRLIRKGPKGISRIQVLTGLQPGDKLIIQGHRLVGDGQAVTIRARGVDAISGNQIKGKLGG